ncbi:MAG: DNA mismatch repair endonuclease MutL [Deltaproteobacteria bacterium]|nr:DNA mismatch repair endonuclease MutL [Deltaproteobacteria bacterium]
MRKVGKAMGLIRILSEKVASQIAAGEVVERPASVVRELIDNSIDSGASRILIKIENGGRNLIRVADNGAGMDRDDLLLCAERHATSKINELSDLFSVRTLGFRGEAIPSIAAVSRMAITSRTPDQLAGFRLKLQGGKIKEIEETGAPLGTTVEVKDLFFNTPARKKFLRSAPTETDHIVDTLSRIALPFTKLSFRLDDRDKILLSLPSVESDVSRLSALFGHEVAGSMIPMMKEIQGLRLSGYLSPPEWDRARGDHLFMYVNRRSVRERLLTHAVIEGYGSRLMKGRYPYAVIFIEIDPALVDVNVHPAKQEVRFHQNRLVHEAVKTVVEEILRQKAAALFRVPSSASEGAMERVGRIEEPIGEYASTPAEVTIFREPEPQVQLMIKESPVVLGQLKETYILCETKEGLLLVDQHAAHERRVFEKLKKSYDSATLECQPFLIPPTVEFSPSESRTILKKMEELSQLGITLEHFGGSTFMVRSVPNILVDVHWESFLREILPLLEEQGAVKGDQVVESLLSLMACHGAIRAGQRLSKEEMIALVEQLDEVEVPTNCPHGRPVFKRLSFYEIEKMFRRVL